MQVNVLDEAAKMISAYRKDSDKLEILQGLIRKLEENVSNKRFFYKNNKHTHTNVVYSKFQILFF